MRELSVLASHVATKLMARNQTIAIAESSAGGLMSSALLAVPGASAYFLGGGVIYTLAAREGLLGITDADMAGKRPSTEDYARLLARTIRGRLGADWGLSETGAAGPSGNRYGDASGHACVAVSGAREIARTLETGSPERPANMRAFACAALELLDEVLGD